MKIYIAGPISGKSGEEVVNYFNSTKDTLKGLNYDVFSPMTAKSKLRTAIELKSHGYEGSPVTTNHAIIERDRWMVDQSDIIYANVSGTERISIGTCMELAWGHDKGKHTVVVMEKDNIHMHAFVIEAADIIFETHQEAMQYLHNLSEI